MPYSPRLGQEVGMRFLGVLLRAIFTGRRGCTPGGPRKALEENLREKIHRWQHQAVLYETAGLPRLARRCREVASGYRVKLVALAFKDEAA
jgi:hypothetical protein